MNQRLRIGCDIDGILADCAGAILRYNQGLGIIPKDYPVQDPPSYLMSTTWPGIRFDCFNETHFWRGLNPFPGAKDFMDALKQIGDVVLISHCSDVVGRCEWLRRHGLSDNGFIPANGPDRAALVDVLDLQIFIDDSPENIDLLTSTKAAVLGRRWAYNAHMAGDGVFLGSYDEIMDQVEIFNEFMTRD